MNPPSIDSACPSIQGKESYHGHGLPSEREASIGRHSMSMAPTVSSNASQHSQKSRSDDPPIQEIQFGRASTTTTYDIETGSLSPSQCYDQLKNQPCQLTCSCSILSIVFGFPLSCIILMSLSFYGTIFFQDDPRSIVICMLISFVQPSVVAVLLYNLLRQRAFGLYGSQGRHISATGILYRHKEGEVVIEYEPDLKDSSIFHTKIVDDALPEDFEMSTSFDIVVLPNIPTSAVLKKSYEKSAFFGQWIILGTKVVLFISVALACNIFTHLIQHNHHFEGKNGEAILVDYERLGRFWEGWGICLILIFSLAGPLCLAYPLAAVVNNEMLYGKSGPVLLPASTDGCSNAESIGSCDTATVSDRSNSDQGWIGRVW